MRRSFVGGLTLVVLLAMVCSAQAEGWQWPNLNPFSPAKKTSPYRVNDGKSSSWLPSWGQSSAPRNGPTTWQKVQAAPANMYNGTKKALAPLNPFKAQPKKTSMFMGPKKQDEPSGFWPNWMTVEEKQAAAPITVSDWLNNAKPGDE